MSGDAEVAVIIVNYNGRWLLEWFLPSVVRSAESSSRRTRIYLVDNNSSDDSVAWLSATYPDIRLIKSKLNTMWGGGNNLGATHAIAENPALQWLVFLNNDAEVPATFIDGITTVPTATPDVGIVGVKAVFWYRYLGLHIEHSIDPTFSEPRGTLYAEIGGLTGHASKRVICDAGRTSSGYIINCGGTFRVPVENVDGGYLTLRLAHRRDQPARLIVKVTTKRPLAACSVPNEIAPAVSGGDTLSGPVTTTLRLPFNGGTANLKLPWQRADCDDVLNNAGTWVDTDAGDCGDIGINTPDFGQYDEPRLVDAICGVAMAVRKEAFLALGGFDQRYTLYYEDTDFCVRAARVGINRWYNPAVTIRHLHSATSQERSDFWRRHTLRSLFIFRARHQEGTGFIGWRDSILKHRAEDPLVQSVFDELADTDLVSTATEGSQPAFQGRSLCL